MSRDVEKSAALSRGIVRSAEKGRTGRSAVRAWLGVSAWFFAITIPIASVGWAVREAMRHSAEEGRTTASPLGDEGDAVVDTLWKAFAERRGPDRTRDLASFREFLDQEGLEDGRSEVYDPTDDSPIADLRPASRGLIKKLLVDAFENRILPVGSPKKPLRIDISREDRFAETTLRLRARLRDEIDEIEERTAEWKIGGSEFRGFDFALLAQNINCILCHASIDDVGRYYNDDPDRYGTFRRVRVGALETLNIRAKTANSRIAGSVSVRGIVTRDDGSRLDTLRGTTVVSAEFDRRGLLRESEDGMLLDRDFDGAPKSSETLDANLFMADVRAGAVLPDDFLPVTFPSPIPDVDKDRTVDADEFEFVARRATGRILGGQKTIVPTNAIFDKEAMPDVDETGPLGGTISGNLLLRGSFTDPVFISGRVAVDGDLLIEGFIRGSGVIYVRGNAYVVGPLEYADRIDDAGKREFGVGIDGRPNRFALAAGGSILLGDVLSTSESILPCDKVTGDRSGTFNFAISEAMLFNRIEWAKTQRELIGTDGVPRPNPTFDPSHRPRYYRIFEHSPVFVMNNGARGKVGFDPDSRSWRGMEAAPRWESGGWNEYGDDAEQLTGAAVHAFMPGKWMPATTLTRIWRNAAVRHAGGPFRVDGLFYTNNAIMFMAPKRSAWGGSLFLNGALVAADIGILAPGSGGVGMQLNYDDRLGSLLEIRDLGAVEIVRIDRR